MRRTAPILAIIFLKLERFYGKQHRSDGAYNTGWDKLSQDVGLNPRALLDAVPHEPSFAVDRRSMVSEVRASKVDKNARVQYTNSPGVRAVPQKRAVTNRKRLTNSSSCAQPAADRILLFAGISPLAAIPSDHTHVLIRFASGKGGR
jgi:hypothetical protein